MFLNLISSGGQPGDTPALELEVFFYKCCSRSINYFRWGTLWVISIYFSQDQIETMNVLKDASSTALYGSRGANGAIIIINY